MGRQSAPYVRHLLASLRKGETTALEVAEALEMTRRHVYQLYRQYLVACAGGQADTWQPGRSGGNHRPSWGEAVEGLLHRLLGAKPPLSYSFAASEVLRRLGVRLDRATVRRWARRAGLKSPKTARRKPAAVRRWQCSHIGALWQLDVSPHRWWGERGPLLPLFDLLDDCSRVITGARIYARETLLNYLDFLPRAFESYGLPVALYVDYHSFFWSQQPESLTQLGKALAFYGVTLKYAPTPEAKGKIERQHLFWQNRLPALFIAEKIIAIPPANHLIELLRVHHNEEEVHREIQCTPQSAWRQAIHERRSVLRPKPACPWWQYVWCLRSTIPVGSDGRISVGTQRLRVEWPPHSRVVRCLHPSGAISVLAAPPKTGLMPRVLLHYTPPQNGNFDRTKLWKF